MQCCSRGEGDGWSVDAAAPSPVPGLVCDCLSAYPFLDFPSFIRHCHSSLFCCSPIRRSLPHLSVSLSPLSFFSFILLRLCLCRLYHLTQPRPLDSHFPERLVKLHLTSREARLRHHRPLFSLSRLRRLHFFLIHIITLVLFLPLRAAVRALSRFPVSV